MSDSVGDFECSTLRIFRIYQRRPPLPGGMEYHISALTREQRLLGIDVVSIYNEGFDPKPNLQILKGWKLSSIKPQFVRDFIFYLFVYIRCRSLKRENKVDIIHVHGDYSAFLWSKFFLKSTLKPHMMIASVHDELLKPARIYRKVLRFFDQIYVSGHRDVRFLKSCNLENVYLFNSGIDDIAFGASKGKKTFDLISVGNFVSKKNFKLLLEIAKEQPDWRIALVGDGPLVGSLKGYCDEYKIENVTFLGRLKKKDVIEVLKSSRVYISTALSEGTPTTLIEAMASGLPVITTPSNDFEWMIENGRNGYISDSWDAGELIKLVSKALGDKEFLRQSSAKNLQFAKSQLWSEKSRFLTSNILEYVKTDG